MENEGVEIDHTICFVCQTAVSKYTCPKCALKYCGVACYKAHQVGCKQRKLEAHQEEPEIEEKAKRNDHELLDEEFREDITGSLIAKENLYKIKESEKVMELLKEPYIQRAILSIMTSPDREKRLIELKANTEFSILIDELLLCVGVAKRREDGDIEFEF